MISTLPFVCKLAVLGIAASAFLVLLPSSGDTDEKAKIEPVHGVIPFWADGSDYVCHKAKGKITLDGKLDEPDWQRAAKIVLVTPCDKKQPLTATFARLLWDDQYLYFAAEVEDHDLCGTAEGHDAPWGEDDVTEMFVKPETDQPDYFKTGFWEFHATPQGATRDYLWPTQGDYPEAVARKWDSGMKLAVKAEGTLNNFFEIDKGYTFEMAIPLAAFSKLAPSPKPGDRWRFVVSRYDYSGQNPAGVEYSASAYLPKIRFNMWEHYPYMVFGE
ncbi:MAG TPA: carbohydrate-binding family 9-like protein [Armatimonadota bacterium]|jgi:hypothetical protein